MKALWLVIGVVVLIGLVFFLQDNTGVEYIDDEQMEEVMDDNDEMIEDGMTDDGMDEVESMGMPAGEENADVDEMIVADPMDEMMAGDKGSADEEEMTEAAVKEFTLDSFNFGYSMEEIRVKEGDTVTINLTNSDGFHDWVVDEFGAATEKINAGGETSVTFVADKAGTYEYYCSVGSHRENGMVGTLIVE